VADPKPRRHRKRFVPPPEPADDMRAWLRGEGTIICELPDGSRRGIGFVRYCDFCRGSSFGFA